MVPLIISLILPTRARKRKPLKPVSFYNSSLRKWFDDLLEIASVAKARKKHQIPDLVPRRSSRHKSEGEEEGDDTLELLSLADLGTRRNKTKQSDKSASPDSASKSSDHKDVKSPEEEERKKKIEAAVELKPLFKMAKGEWYTILDALERYLFIVIPFVSLLNLSVSEDKHHYFLSPVEKLIPEYTTVINHPMCFETMRKRVKWLKYNKWDNFWVL